MKVAKFRIWDEYTKKMYLPERLFCQADGTVWHVDVGGHKSFVLGRGVHQLMQYTGLKDKHDQEIYEGDIVNQLSEMTYDDIQGVVKFIDGSYLIETADGKTGYYLFGEVVYNEVIGNIYENPELI